MNKRVLFIDDDENILDNFRRNLSRHFEITTTTSPLEGLAMMQVEAPFAVIVADQRMPQMDGVELLAKVAKSCPDTVRIMLTGFAELDTAVLAVNEGSVFRFLTKPCDTKTLIQVLEAGVEQHRLVTSEKTFLRRTLKGCVEILTEIISLANPEAYGRAERAKRLVRELHKRRGLPNFWKIETAAMLSQIGLIFIPPEIAARAITYDGRDTRSIREDAQVLAMVPTISADLLSKIPYLEDVAEAIRNQYVRFSDNPGISLPSRVLKLALDFDALTQMGNSRLDALDTMRGRTGWYDMDLFPAFEKAVCDETGFTRRTLNLGALRPGMVLQEDLVADNGLLLMVSGQELTEPTLLKLSNFRKSHALKPEVLVLVPLAQIEEVDGTVRHIIL